jgi:hypothetical protein
MLAPSSITTSWPWARPRRTQWSQARRLESRHSRGSVKAASRSMMAAFSSVAATTAPSRAVAVAALPLTTSAPVLNSAAAVTRPAPTRAWRRLRRDVFKMISEILQVRRDNSAHPPFHARHLSPGRAAYENRPSPSFALKNVSRCGNAHTRGVNNPRPVTAPGTASDSCSITYINALLKGVPDRPRARKRAPNNGRPARRVGAAAALSFSTPHRRCCRNASAPQTVFARSVQPAPGGWCACQLLERAQLRVVARWRAGSGVVRNAGSRGRTGNVLGSERTPGRLR